MLNMKFSGLWSKKKILQHSFLRKSIKILHIDTLLRCYEHNTVLSFCLGQNAEKIFRARFLNFEQKSNEKCFHPINIFVVAKVMQVSFLTEFSIDLGFVFIRLFLFKLEKKKNIPTKPQNCVHSHVMNIKYLQTSSRPTHVQRFRENYETLHEKQYD